MRRFLTSRLPSNHHPILLDNEVSHHLLRVVGIAPNEQVELVDGFGQGCIAKLMAVEQGLAKMEWVALLDATQKRQELWLCLALTKGDAFSNALRMSTELGVSHIVPMITERTIVKGEKLSRWIKIVEGASMQSKRVMTPTVHPLHSFKETLQFIPKLSHSWVLHPNATRSLSMIDAPTALWIGPEGGFTEKELALLNDAGVQNRSLGPLVLKADTAAVVATAMALATSSS